MSVLRHSVSVVALSVERLHEVTGLVLDLAESSRSRGEEVLLEDGRPVEGLRLVEGRHLRPGARYELVDDAAGDRVVVLVREWRRRSAIVLETTLTSDDMTLTLRAALRLRAPDRPRLVEAEGWVRGAEGTGRLRRGSGKGRFDPAAWWGAAGPATKAPRTTRAPATVRLKHLLGEAVLQLRPEAGAEGRWQVDVTARLRGRWLLRPVVALALATTGSLLRRNFRTSVDDAAAAWNEAVDRLMKLSPDELRARLTDGTTGLTTPHPPGDAAG
ncbi:hypothetical protein [Actinacidiphila alni]|uniref:hypothetical protein n=1 Tax=Actinacidiphila alni TaxID=380248 RepID=UPI0034533AAA